MIGSFLAPSRDMGLMVFNPKPWRGWLTWAGAVITGVGQNQAGYELGARYVDVEDDAVTLTSHQVQAGGKYFVTPWLRVMSNVVLPIGEDEPRHATRWWSRVQYNF